MTLMSGLGSMASLFLGASPAAAEPAPQVHVQMQPQSTDRVADLTTQVVLQSRHGELLTPTRMVKLDPYPGMHTTALQRGEHPQPLIEGAPNFREVPGSNVFGVAQPTVDGLKGVLRSLHAAPGDSGPPVVWSTLREEPVVYIAGRSFTLRELSTPFANLEAPGISSEAVERQEQTLKGEVLAELQRYGGRFLVHEENADGQIVARWLQVTPDQVQTPREVFQSLQQEGYRVDYARVPITDEKAPENADFDALVTRLQNADPNSPLIFNCHAGRGRTTTGMIIGELLRHQQSAPRTALSSDPFEEGHYRAINDLVSSLREGQAAKDALDAVIDQSGQVQNLRTAIAKLKRNSESPSTRSQQAHENLERGKDYLYRYYKLIAFQSYLREMQPQGFPETFTQWISHHPELNISPEMLQLVYNQVQQAAGMA